MATRGAAVPRMRALTPRRRDADVRDMRVRDADDDADIILVVFVVVVSNCGSALIKFCHGIAAASPVPMCIYMQLP